MKRTVNLAKEIELRMTSETARQIRQHARSSIKTEVCGILIGSESGSVTSVEACIQGANSLQAGTHVTFTQDTWEHIYRIKDRDYPDARIVGWYHSHPGFGVFLSDHDTFIHKNFFSAPQQVAWVYDPHSDEEGCFGWSGSTLERLTRVVIVDEKGGELAGETGKPEPLLVDTGEDEPQPARSAPFTPHPTEAQAALKTGMTILSYLLVLAFGFLLSWFLFPRILVVPFDPATGQPILGPSEPSITGGQALPHSGPAGKANPSGAPSPAPATPTPAPQAAKGKQ
jgi:proteasome lid subunit RPN8/RPN11